MGMFSENRIEWLNYSLVSLLVSGCLLFSHPKVLEFTINFVFVRLKKEKVQVQYSFSKILAVIFLEIIYWFILSYAFFLLIRSVYVIELSMYFDVAFAFTTSWLIGYLTILAPAGLGVREELLIIYLSKILPKFATPVIAVVARFWIVASEIVSLALILLLHKLFHKEKLKLVLLLLVCWVGIYGGVYLGGSPK